MNGRMCLVLIAGICFGLAPAPVLGQSRAATELEITTTADSGPGSLRWALEQARGDDGPYRIHFGDREGLFSTPQTIELESPLPEVNGEVTIDGFIRRHLWTAYGATVSAGGQHRIFEVAPGATLHLMGVTLTDGRAREGGAILNRGRLIVEATTLLRNHANRHGGAIVNRGGEVFFINSTAADGRARRGGAIANRSGQLTVTHGTFYRNEARNGAAIFSRGPLALANSILWGTEGAEGGQCANTGELVHSITNLFLDDSEGCGTPLLEDDPKIGRFGYYNGPTPVFIIEGDSPALNLASTEAAVDHQGKPLVWDQRGNGDPRFAWGYADIGAFEVQIPFPGKFVIDTIEDTGLRGCTPTREANCPLRAAVELGLGVRQPSPIHFHPRVFVEPQTLRLETLPENLDRWPLEFDGEGVAPVTIVVPEPVTWEARNGVQIVVASGGENTP